MTRQTFTITFETSTAQLELGQQIEDALNLAFPGTYMDVWWSDTDCVDLRATG